MTTEPANFYTSSSTGETYELADEAWTEALLERARNQKPGELLWAYRKDSGLKQQEAAKILGVSPQMLSQWESGAKLPSPAKAREIAEKLGMPIVSFLQLVTRAWLAREGVDDVLDVVALSESVDGTVRQVDMPTPEKGTVKDISPSRVAEPDMP